MADELEQDTTDGDPLGDALAEVAAAAHQVGSLLPMTEQWVRVSDARRIAEDAATQAYIDAHAGD